MKALLRLMDKLSSLLGIECFTGEPYGEKSRAASPASRIPHYRKVPLMNLTGSVALVTGANRGLGARLVTELLHAGAAKVYATSRTPACSR